jgi:hypothetical protein
MYVVLATSIGNNWRRLCKSDASCFGLIVGQWSLLSLISGKRNERPEQKHGKTKRVRGLSHDKMKTFDGVVCIDSVALIAIEFQRCGDELAMTSFQISSSHALKQRSLCFVSRHTDMVYSTSGI